jgi:CheY-like chemotaxis protein
MESGRILIAEDQDSARQALTSLLRDEGYVVAEAVDGDDAVSKIASFQPDVLLSDLRMPNLDGLGLLKAVGRGSAKVAFLLMTAFISDAAAAEARELGCEVILRKPLDLDAILTAVRSAMVRSTARDPIPSS